MWPHRYCARPVSDVCNQLTVAHCSTVSAQHIASYQEVDHLVKHLGKRRHLKICRRPQTMPSPLEPLLSSRDLPIRALQQSISAFKEEETPFEFLSPSHPTHVCSSTKKTCLVPADLERSCGHIDTVPDPSSMFATSLQSCAAPRCLRST